MSNSYQVTVTNRAISELEKLALYTIQLKEENKQIKAIICKANPGEENLPTKSAKCSPAGPRSPATQPSAAQTTVKS